MYSQLELDTAQIGFVHRVSDYYRQRETEGKAGCHDRHQAQALTKFIESWCKLSVDGVIDAQVIHELEKRGLFVTKQPEIVQAHDNPQFTNVAQTTAVTCQSACICMALGWGPEKELEVREKLLKGGKTAGDPWNMAGFMEAELGAQRYQYYDNASMNEIEAWLTAGYFLIVHGYTTTFGHVYALDGLGSKRGKKLISVKDPWGEFDFSAFKYIPGSWFYNGFYSLLGVYATIMAWSLEQAADLYRKGKVEPSLGQAWVHVIKPE